VLSLCTFLFIDSALSQLGFGATDDCELERELGRPLVLLVEVEAVGAIETLLAVLPFVPVLFRPRLSAVIRTAMSVSKCI
jgi:hypothetical protein